MRILERFYFPFFMSSFMTVIMSFTLTAIHQGFHPDFLSSWGKAFSIAFPIAFFSVIFVAPVVMKLSESLKRKDDESVDIRMNQSNPSVISDSLIDS